MSTDAQLKGDSLRRQLQQSLDYAARQGWEVAEQDQLRDIGISAFSGANVCGGALGQFLEAIRDRKVQEGSFLIIESLDRLSRQEVLKSLGLFIEILGAGVNIVTLTDGKTYTSASDFTDLTLSIAVMSRAHEESRTKSHRIRAAWAHKRKTADARKLTAKCPSWLRLSADRESFEVLSERANIIASMFEDSAAGLGSYTIARRLNDARTPTFGRGKGWRSSTIAKFLASRAVLGEFQLHRVISGKQVPEGEPIKNYFPSIVSEQLFYRANAAKSVRRVSGRGRKGATISNLFSGLAKCAYCKSAMAFETKGRGLKRRTYLSCDGAKHGLSCERQAWRYDDLEASFLAFVKELDLESLMRGESETNGRAALDNDIASLRGRLASLDEQRERTFDLYAKSGSAADFVGQKLHAIEEERTKVVNALAQKEGERDRLKSEIRGFYESKDQIKALLTRLQQPGSDDVYKLRAQISARLKSLVTDIYIAPVGSAPLTRRAIEYLRQRAPEASAEAIANLMARLNEEREHRRYFLVGFKDGTLRGVLLSSDDPLQFEAQIVFHREGEGSLEQTAESQESWMPTLPISLLRDGGYALPDYLIPQTVLTTEVPKPRPHGTCDA
jgi:DNA invertase Pin-like site-specific DNA recombinase